MRKVNCNVLSGVDTGSVNGVAVDSNQLVSASFQIVFGDATAAGTFKIQGCNDIDTDGYQFPSGTFTPTNWTDIPSQVATIASGASAILTIANMSYRFVRAVYVSGSGGSTTVSVNMFALSM